MKPIQTAGVIGLGSLGVLYATLFTRALGKEQVPVLADGARIARYRKQGFWYNDAPCDFNYTDAAARTEPVDLLLFAVKFGGLQNAIETCRHLVGPDTLLISVLNGISSEEILGDAFGPEHVVWCVAERMAAKKEGNRVVCDPIGELAVGVPAGEDTSRLQRLTAFLTASASPMSYRRTSAPTCGASCCATPAATRPPWCSSAITARCRCPESPGTP